MTAPRAPAGVAQTRAWATVDLDAIEHNVRAIRGLCGAPTAIMAVVKADAYGHGAIEVARAAIAAGATWLGVATLEEALELRGAGVGERVLIFGPLGDGEAERAVVAECVLTVADRAGAVAAQRFAGVRPRMHIKVDTGMTRLGAAPEDLDGVLDAIDPARASVDGVYTHLACADDPSAAMTRAQLAAFSQAAGTVRMRHPHAIRHAAASAGALGWPEAALDLVRIGIAMYGVPPAPHLSRVELRPAMTLASRVIRTRRVAAGTPVSYGAEYRAPSATTIATVPLGYGDGYPRALSGVGRMLVRGARFPIAGRVCMDFTMLDVGDAEVRDGDEVTAFGAGLPAAEVAASAGTIAYELFCRLGRRVPRVYTRAGRVVATRPGIEVG